MLNTPETKTAAPTQVQTQIQTARPSYGMMMLAAMVNEGARAQGQRSQWANSVYDAYFPTPVDQDPEAPPSASSGTKRKEIG